MRMTRLLLIVTVFMGLMLCTFTAQAAMNVEQICAKKDFMEFVDAFSEITVQQQAACMRFPLKIGEETYATQQAFLASPAAEYKIIASQKEVGKSGETATPFFLPLPPDRNLDQFDLGLKYVYLIEKDGDKCIVTLTEGGTFAFSAVEFLWSGKQWMIIEVRK